MAVPSTEEEAQEFKSLMTEENYRDWLGQFTAQQTVGYANNLEERPLARFMTEMAGHKAMVMPTRTSIGNCHYTNPNWAITYINKVDTIQPNQIRKVRAIRLLEDMDRVVGDPL